MKEGMNGDGAVTGDLASSVAAVYEKETQVDNTAVFNARLGQLSGFVVTQSNIKDAKAIRAKLGSLLDDCAASRMAVQRAIKKHPIGVFAFEKGEVEKAVEAEKKRVDAEIKAIENAAKNAMLNEEVEDFCCIVRGTLAQVNELAVAANKMGLRFENHGPVCNSGKQNEMVV